MVHLSMLHHGEHGPHMLFSAEHECLRAVLCTQARFGRESCWGVLLSAVGRSPQSGVGICLKLKLPWGY